MDSRPAHSGQPAAAWFLLRAVLESVSVFRQRGNNPIHMPDDNPIHPLVVEASLRHLLAVLEVCGGL
jgi:hypothetical protein